MSLKFQLNKAVAWLIPLVVSLGALFSSPCLLAAEPSSDQAVTDAVEDRIEKDRVVPVSRINVQTAGGVVTLSGVVDNLLARDRAVALAESVPGVLEVTNNINVKPVRRTDTEVLKDVRRALEHNPALRNRKFAVRVRNANVFLSGIAHSWQERDLAEKMAESVRGIRAIRNDINIRYEKERPDEEIRKDVEQALEWDALIGPGRVKVEVRNGKVTLEGAVRSAAAKRRARILSWVAGVKDVYATPLAVAGGKEPAAVRAEEYRKDEDIQGGVERALQRDGRTSDYVIIVQVKEGVVVLRGVVENLEAKRTSEEDAASIAGVVAVKNILKVAPTSQYEDRQLAEEIRKSLDANPHLHGFNIRVRVRDGIVSLSGTVNSRFQREQAEVLVSRVPGVIDVNDHLISLDTWHYP